LIHSRDWIEEDNDHSLFPTGIGHDAFEDNDHSLFPTGIRNDIESDGELNESNRNSKKD
jgi:hypothetical protein